MRKGWPIGDQWCTGIIPGTDTDPRYRHYGGIVCMRLAGHAPPCIAMARDAAKADGYCDYCRSPIGEKHEPDCHTYEASRERGKYWARRYDWRAARWHRYQRRRGY